jgi:hypothetical protein
MREEVVTHGNGKRARMQAYEAIRGMEKPASWSDRKWVGVERFLWAIARRYPEAYPSQETLAAQLHVSVNTIQNYVRWAKEAGLLVVWYDAGVSRRGNPSKTSQYHIAVLLPELLVDAPTNGGAVPPTNGGKETGDTDVSPISKQHPSGEKSSTSHHRVVRAARAARTSVEGVEKPQGRGKKVTASEVLAGMQPKYIKRPPRATDPDPARRMARYFGESWMAMVDGRPEFNDTRPWESKGATVGYLNTVFFKPEYGKAYTEVEVRAYIDRFIEGVRTGYTIVKRGQSAWMRFTGWWGRDTGTADSIFRESADKYLR